MPRARVSWSTNLRLSPSTKPPARWKPWAKRPRRCWGGPPATSWPSSRSKDGVIADFKVTERMLNYFIQKAHGRKVLVYPRIVIGVPSEITQVEKRAVMDSAYRTKASEVYLVEQAMMAAIIDRK